MRPRRLDQPEDEIFVYLNKSLETGILNWQELGYLEFKDLVRLSSQKLRSHSELECTPEI